MKSRGGEQGEEGERGEQGRSDDRGDVVARVRHPILRLEVLHPDGTRSAAHRVFCRFQKRSVDAGTCCACVHCDSIELTPDPPEDAVARAMSGSLAKLTRTFRLVPNDEKESEQKIREKK